MTTFSPTNALPFTHVLSCNIALQAIAADSNNFAFPEIYAEPITLALSYISKVPHYYKQVPITVFTLNKDEESIFAQVISLQDAYNTVLSDNLNDYETFADAYMVIKGMTADDDDLDSMKTHRVLLMDSDASAEYLTKNFSDAQTQNILNTINKKIHSIANSPDFTDETFMAEIGLNRSLVKPDFDNIEKLYADMYNSNVWIDDALTIDATIGKYYSILPRVEIDLKYLNAVFCKQQFDNISNRKDYDTSMNLSFI